MEEDSWVSLRFEVVFEPEEEEEEDPMVVSWKLCREAFGNGGRSPANMAGIVFCACVVFPVCWVCPKDKASLLRRLLIVVKRRFVQTGFSSSLNGSFEWSGYDGSVAWVA